MREFKAKDIFLLSLILDKIEFDEDLNGLFEAAKAKQKDRQAFLGGKLILVIFKRFHKAKDEILQLASELSEMSVEEVGELSIKELKDIFMSMVNNEDFKDFFKQAVEDLK